MRQVLVSPGPDDTWIPNLVEEGYDHVVLLYGLAIEVLPHCLRQVFLALPPVDGSPGHGR